jgi:Rieske Fe-S protein
MTTTSPTSDPCPGCLSRRTLVTALSAGAALALSGCAVYGDQGPAAAEPAPGSPAEPAPGSPAEPAPGSPAGEPLAALADLPVGAGIVLASAGVVVTRPAENDVRGFTTVCTHAGCAVSEVRDGVIRCPCHGSVFDIATGEPRGGPATRPLEPVAVAVAGDEVVRA